MIGAQPKQRILLIEDDPGLASLIAEFLDKHGFDVTLEGNGRRGIHRILEDCPDLVILDVMLPGADGFEVCRQVRPRYRGPVVMLTSRSDEVDEVVGLELGADDYIAKPVRPRVLLARIRSFLRRNHPQEVAPPSDAAKTIAVGSLVVSVSSRTAVLHGESIELTTAEFDLLWFLARRCGETVSREEIFHGLLGIEYDGLDRSIDLRVSRIRKKLGDVGSQLIKSVRGTGYMLAEDP